MANIHIPDAERQQLTEQVMREHGKVGPAATPEAREYAQQIAADTIAVRKQLEGE